MNEGQAPQKLYHRILPATQDLCDIHGEETVMRLEQGALHPPIWQGASGQIRSTPTCRAQGPHGWPRSLERECFVFSMGEELTCVVVARSTKPKPLPQTCAIRPDVLEARRPLPLMAP